MASRQKSHSTPPSTKLATASLNYPGRPSLLPAAILTIDKALLDAIGQRFATTARAMGETFDNGPSLDVIAEELARLKRLRDDAVLAAVRVFAED